MSLTTELLTLTVLLTVVNASPRPGGSYHHVHHRIHVPQKIKTIYHTKIVKVPEHHHHFHEKEKIIIEKEKPKEEHHPIILKEDHHHHHVLKEEDHDGWSGLESSDVFKKKRYALHPLESKNKKIKKRRVVQRHSYKFHQS